MAPTADNERQGSPTRPAGPELHLVIGYDGSPGADRALDAAVRLMAGRPGDIDVVYVAHMPNLDMFSAAAMAQMQFNFDVIEQELRDLAAARLDGHGATWTFERRRGRVADELTAAGSAAHDARPDDHVVVVVGASSHASHRILGSVAVSLAHHCPVPLLIVP